MLLPFRLNDMSVIAGGPGAANVGGQGAAEVRGLGREPLPEVGSRPRRACGAGLGLRRDDVILMPSSANLGAYVDPK